MNTSRLLSNEFGDRYLYEVNRNTFARIGANSQFQRAFGESFTTPDTLHIIVGTDSGLLTRFVHGLDRPEGSKYLFIELPDLIPIIRPLIEKFVDDEHIVLSTPEQWQTDLQRLNVADYVHNNSLRVHASLGVADGFLEDYQALKNSVQQTLDGIVWSLQQRLGHPVFIATQIQNLVYNRTPAIRLRDSFAGKTAVVLGGGPSLDEFLPWVSRHREQLLVIAVSRVSRRLVEAGIYPHIVVTVDPSQMSFEVSREMLTLPPDTLLVNAYHASPKLLGQWPGRSVYLGKRYPWKDRKEVENAAAVGPTVTNAAIETAVLLGVRHIILGGVDLCHDRHGYTHAKGSVEHELGPRPASLDIEIPTNDGGTATTTPDFYNAMLSIQGQARQAAALGVEILNPAPGAAHMEAVRHVAMDALPLTSLERPATEIIAEHLGKETSAERLADYQNLTQSLARVNGRIRAMIKLAEDALDCNARLFGRKGKPADFRYKKRMDKIERQLDRKYKDLAGLVKLFSARAFLRMPPSDREWSNEELEQAGITYYTAYRDNARNLLALFEAAQEYVTFAIAEESDRPDMAALAKHWLEHDIPGRARVWRRLHPDTDERLDQRARAELDRLDAAFQTQLLEQDTLHRKQLAQSFDLSGIRARLHLLHTRQDLQGLERLRRQLTPLDGPQAKELAVLASGYIALLRDTRETAFTQFAQLIDLAQQNMGEDAPNPRLEDALCNMATIALDLGQNEQALLILETLNELSPNYLPQFGELLRLTGHIPEAETLYSEHLENHPDDAVTMLALGRLYQEQGAQESARMAFQHILARDPANEDARTLLGQMESSSSP